MTFRQSKQHGLLGRVAPVLTSLAVGCSLIVPLDEYVGHGSPGGGTSAGAANGGGDTTGGTESVLGGSGGSVGGSSGGNVAVGGTGNGASGGSEISGGGTGETGGTDGGTENGGAFDPGGMAGEAQAGDGPGTALGGTAGSRTGGAGGRAGLGGVAGSGGRAGRGGMGGAAGASCGKVDFKTDHDHCGSCEIACETAAECLDGVCRSSPCDGVCETFTTIHLMPTKGYKTTANLGTGESCTEVIGYEPVNPPSFVCWNVTSPRTVELNGVVQTCDVGGREFDVPLRVGGYCVHVTAGQKPEAGFEFPD